MDSIPQDVVKLLGPSEQVQLFIKQKIYHPKLNVESVILTTQRIILRHPHDLGLRKDYTDFSYTDIANAILDKGMLRSTVKCVLRFGGDPLMLNDLPTGEAEKAYGIIRENLVRFQTPFYAGYPGMNPGMNQGMAPVMAPVMQQGPQVMTASSGPVCKKCGQRSAPGTRFCGSCGSQL
jgi:PH (Pleckstrin Homology) domain-containing protein